MKVIIIDSPDPVPGMPCWWPQGRPRRRWKVFQRRGADGALVWEIEHGEEELPPAERSPVGPAAAR